MISLQESRFDLLVMLPYPDGGDEEDFVLFKAGRSDVLNGFDDKNCLYLILHLTESHLLP